MTRDTKHRGVSGQTTTYKATLHHLQTIKPSVVTLPSPNH